MLCVLSERINLYNDRDTILTLLGVAFEYRLHPKTSTFRAVLKALIYRSYLQSNLREDVSGCLLKAGSHHAPLYGTI